MRTSYRSIEPKGIEDYLKDLCLIYRGEMYPTTATARGINTIHKGDAPYGASPSSIKRQDLTLSDNGQKYKGLPHTA